MMRFTGDGFEDIDIEDEDIFDDNYAEDECDCPVCQPDLYDSDELDLDVEDDGLIFRSDYDACR